MGWKIPDDAIQEIRDRVSIVEVVSAHVTLKRAGRNFVGLCPFHGEKTPSFNVSDERGWFHCFGCGAGGDVFTFVRRMEGVDFREAVELLARRAGMELRVGAAGGAEASERERLVDINAWAATKFVHALQERQGDVARRYLEQRGVEPAIAREYGVGFAPPTGGFLVRFLKGKAGALAAAVRAGLIGQGQRGGYYDRFRERLMFPIHDPRGRVLGFGGRALGNDTPKYLNSPESLIFQKRRVLYGLPQARDVIRACGEAIVVEGYMDALALAGGGIRNVVATLGTALTAAHMVALQRAAGRIVVFFDGDAAGRQAASRAFEVCAEAGAWPDAAFLPDGEDPDSFVRKHGVAEVRALLSRAVPLLDFYFDRLRARTGTSLAERARAAEDVSRILARVKSPVERDLLYRKAVEKLGVSEEALRATGRRTPVRAAAAVRDVPQQSPGPAAERLLLEIMVADQQVSQWVRNRGTIQQFRDPHLAAWATRVVDAWGAGERAVTAAIADVPAPLAAKLSAALVDRSEADAETRRESARDCVERIEASAARLEAESTLRELRRAELRGDEERERELLRRAQEQLRRREGTRA